MHNLNELEDLDKTHKKFLEFEKVVQCEHEIMTSKRFSEEVILALWEDLSAYDVGIVKIALKRLSVRNNYFPSRNSIIHECMFLRRVYTLYLMKDKLDFFVNKYQRCRKIGSKLRGLYTNTKKFRFLRKANKLQKIEDFYNEFVEKIQWAIKKYQEIF